MDPFPHAADLTPCHVCFFEMFTSWLLKRWEAKAIQATQHLLAAFFAARSPERFFRRVDRSSMKFADPFPGLEHEYTEINGVRCDASAVAGPGSDGFLVEGNK